MPRDGQKGTCHPSRHTRGQGKNLGTVDNGKDDLEQQLLAHRDKSDCIPGINSTTKENILHHLLMMQYSPKKRLKVFSAPGTEAIYREMKQLHDQKVCEPRKAHSLSAQQCHDALGYLMVLKGKCNGLIKARVVLMVENSTCGLQKRMKLRQPLQLIPISSPA